MTKLICCIILFLTTFSLRAENLLPIGSSCVFQGMDGIHFTAKCSAANGQAYLNDIELRGVINRDGILTFEGDSSVTSSPITTCKDLDIDAYFVLSGKCLDNSGRWRRSTLSLEGFIFNYNGTLTYRSSGFLDLGKSCRNLGLKDATLVADCTAEDGRAYPTSIVLRGVNTANGVLYFEKDTTVNSTFHEHCTHRFVDSNGILAGICENVESRVKWSTLDLSKVIGNYNGVLAYRKEK